MAERFPHKIAARFDRLSCIQSDETHAAYLCRDGESGNLCLLKSAFTPERVDQLITDDAMLRSLNVYGIFPAPIWINAEEDAAWQARTWIEGQSLAQYVESAYSGQGLPADEALRIIDQLLDQLKLLHALDPPVIHRDIKPQNIILDKDGQPHLIDFGIARRWKRGQSFDTCVDGTEEIAAPEQFGFRQTDARSDIYALGVLLRYLLTEEYEQDADRRLPWRMTRVIRRATRFDPNSRYQTAEDMQRAVHRLRRPVRRILTACAALALFMLTAGIFIYEGSTYTFREPLIEQAVRMQMDRPEGSISRWDLRKIKEVRIFGRRAYTSEDQFWFLGEHVLLLDAGMDVDGLWRENGHVQRLDDLKAMPNLKALTLYRQEISDISALQNTRIKALGIGYNPVTDLSPLYGNDSIEYLNASCLHIDDPSIFGSLPNLKSLCISGLGEFPFEALEGLSVEELNLADTYDDQDVMLATCESLRKLTLSKLYPGLLRTLKKMRLEALEVTHTQDVTLRELEALETLTHLNYSVGEGSERLADEPLHFPKMRELTLKGLTIPSLRMLEEMKALETLGLYDSVVEDYAGLDALPNLKTIYANAEQRQALEEMYPDATWIIE